MITRSLTIGAILLASVSSGTARAEVIGRDDRKPLPPKMEQVLGNAIGLLVFRKMDAKGRPVNKWGTCTAACVGRHTILTAAHCVMRSRRHEKYIPDLGAMRFILWPGDKKRMRIFDLAGFPFDAERRRFMRAGPGNVKVFNGERPLDWALLPLEKTRACPVRLRMAPVDIDDERLRKGRPLMLVGFHGDLLKRGVRELRYSLCHAMANKYARMIMQRVKRRTGQSVLVHDCDATHGASGSPMLVKKGGKPFIAAVLSGGRQFRRNYKSRKTGKIVKRRILHRQVEAAPAENIIPVLKRMRASGKGGEVLPRLLWQERLMVSTGVLMVYRREAGKWRNVRACTAICTGSRHVIVPTRCIDDAKDGFLSRLVFLNRPHLNEKKRASRAIVEKTALRDAPARGWSVLYLTRSEPVCRPAVKLLEQAPPAGGLETVFVAGFDACKGRKFEDIRLRQVECRGKVSDGRGGGMTVALNCRGALPSGGGVMVVKDRGKRPRLLGVLAPEMRELPHCRRRKQRRVATGGVVFAEALSPAFLR